RRRARFGAGEATAKQPLGSLGAPRRQLEARDPDRVPGDAAEAAGSLEDLVVVCRPVRHVVLAAPMARYPAAHTSLITSSVALRIQSGFGPRTRHSRSAVRLAGPPPESCRVADGSCG